ncbi:unnamed protein product, partial [Bubo scandiacus]
WLQRGVTKEPQVEYLREVTIAGVGPATETEETQDQESVSKDRPAQGSRWKVCSAKQRNQGYPKLKSKSRARSGNQEL